MMRGDSITKPENPGSTLIVAPVKKSGLVVGHMVDPEDRSVHYLIVSSTWINIMAVAILTLLVCGMIVLGMVMYNKSQLDDLEKRVEVPKTDEPR
jgi:hypothetical protein